MAMAERECPAALPACFTEPRNKMTTLSVWKYLQNFERHLHLLAYISDHMTGWGKSCNCCE
jgi:hypothetical protein